MILITKYITTRELPKDRKKAEKNQDGSYAYMLVEGKIFYGGFKNPLLKFLTRENKRK